MIADTRSDVRPVVADVDGTLVTPDKILTPHARAAVRHIVEAGIVFTITSAFDMITDHSVRRCGASSHTDIFES